ncbi:hypothetical protein C8R45DRAFT_558838 [Mycena sanguinolenta]|nr:hypothetical protein C8R45DRAFT_558838 [Mycena sanguinolenta]
MVSIHLDNQHYRLRNGVRKVANFGGSALILNCILLGCLCLSFRRTSRTGVNFVSATPFLLVRSTRFIAGCFESPGFPNPIYQNEIRVQQMLCESALSADQCHMRHKPPFLLPSRSSLFLVSLVLWAIWPRVSRLEFDSDSVFENLACITMAASYYASAAS